MESLARPPIRSYGRKSAARAPLGNSAFDAALAGEKAVSSSSPGSFSSPTATASPSSSMFSSPAVHLSGSSSSFLGTSASSGSSASPHTSSFRQPEESGSVSMDVGSSETEQSQQSQQSRTSARRSSPRKRQPAGGDSLSYASPSSSPVKEAAPAKTRKNLSTRKSAKQQQQQEPPAFKQRAEEVAVDEPDTQPDDEGETEPAPAQTRLKKQQQQQQQQQQPAHKPAAAPAPTVQKVMRAQRRNAKEDEEEQKEEQDEVDESLPPAKVAAKEPEPALKKRFSSLLRTKSKPTPASTTSASSAPSSGPPQRCFSDSTHGGSLPKRHGQESKTSEHEMDGVETEEQDTQPDDTMARASPVMHSPRTYSRKGKLDRSFSSPGALGSAEDTVESPLKSVLEAHTSREAGKQQQFVDDLAFLMDGFAASNAPTMRALSTFKLACLCASGDFRMFLRAHDALPRIFTMLTQGVVDDEILALNTAALLGILSKDTLKAFLDQTTLTLIHNLLTFNPLLAIKTPTQVPVKSSFSLLKPKTVSNPKDAAVKQLTELLRKAAVEVHSLDVESLALLTLQNIFTGQRHMQEELRLLGFLDELLSKSLKIVSAFPRLAALSPAHVTQLRNVDTRLHIVQSALFLNETNQHYIVSTQSSKMIDVLAKLLEQLQGLCADVSTDVEDDVREVAYDSLCSVLKVILSLTNNHDLACQRVGRSGVPLVVIRDIIGGNGGGLDTHQHDCLVLGLSLLVNLVEITAQNRASIQEISLASGHGILQFSLDLFLSRTELSSSQHAIDETSDNIVAAYAAILIGCLCRDNKKNESLLRSYAETLNFSIAKLVRHLQEFVLYQRQAGVNNQVDLTSVANIIEVLEGCCDQQQGGDSQVSL